jgi:hypothetical protein
LEEESRSLREFHVLDIEVPGQYFNDQVCWFWTRFREFFLVKVWTITFYDILSNWFYGGIIFVFVYLMDIGGFDLIAYLFQ